jgi:acetoin utilization protein AcuB
MFVKERMTRPVITVPEDMTVPDAVNLFKREHIRRAPVVRSGKLVGFVSEADLLNASPSPVTSLSIFEVHYLLNKITVGQVMRKNVVTISGDTPIEEAARIMADNKIGGLPVVEDDFVVGIITQTDLFKVLLEMMGAREGGCRVTVLIPDKPGQFAKIGKAFGELEANIISMGTIAGRDSSNRSVTFKVQGLEPGKVQEVVEPLVEEILDIRGC